MAKARHPRRGSMQFWPRKRSRHSTVRVRSWADSSNAKPLGFICYKAGMTHLMVEDNRAKSLTKGETIMVPSTIVECPPMGIMGISFYKNTARGLRKTASVINTKLPKELASKIQLPKNVKKSVDDVKEFDDVRLLVYSQPKLTGIGTKRPKLLEVALGGSKDDKLAYAKENLGKEITVNDIFEQGNYVDVHGVTKGKGFAGTVKRYGVAIKQHKGEKTKRGIGNLGAWTPKRVDFNVPQTGKMGYHLRTEYNKQIISLGEDGKDVTPAKGITKYGVVKNNYMLIKGSIVGPRKRAIVAVHAIRKNPKAPKQAFPVKQIVNHN